MGGLKQQIAILVYSKRLFAPPPIVLPHASFNVLVKTLVSFQPGGDNLCALNVFLVPPKKENTYKRERRQNRQINFRPQTALSPRDCGASSSLPISGKNLIWGLFRCEFNANGGKSWQ